MTEIAFERRALALFESLIDCDAPEVQSALEAIPETEPKLRERVECLLEAYRTQTIRTGGAIADFEEPPPPERIGAYRIGELLGTGGMGSVYSAFRDRGDFEHEVAIKLIKPGALSEKLVERFTRERQTLARFSHPHIARLFDGGETDQQQPYIVMEKIDGTLLTDWLDEVDPPLDERLSLFLQICSAVSHAHRNLIVHRDLTPANVLVDREGQAKLIDFGIARPDGDELGAAGAVPLRNMTLTPGYAAPERLSGEPATTLSDVYSAGRLLGALLPKPRPVELQAVMEMALATDPDERYRSIDALAADIRAFQKNEPVSAMPPRRAYRWRKFVQCNLLAVALTASLVTAVLIGLTLTLWYAQSAGTARREAEARFADTRAIAKTMMFEVYDEVSRVPRSTEARLLLAESAQRYLETLAADGASADVRLDAGLGYFRLAQVVGGRTGGGTVGRIEDGKTYFQRAREILESLHQDHPRRQDITSALARVQTVMADSSLFTDGDHARARRDAVGARKLIESLDQLDADTGEALAATYLHEGNAYAWEAKPESAGKTYALGRKRIGAMDAALRRSLPVRRSLAELWRMTGAYHSYFKRHGEARESLDKALAIHRAIAEDERAGPQDFYHLLTALNMAAQVAESAGDLRSADRYAKEGWQVAERALLANPSDAGLRDVAVIPAIRHAAGLARAGQEQKAVELADRAIAIKRALSQEAGEVVAARMTLAVRLQEASKVYLAAGRTQQACSVMREALQIMQGYQRTAELPVANVEGNLKPLLADLAHCS